MEIAALMRQFPLKYPADKYKGTKKRFSVILNELYEMGKVVAIKPQCMFRSKLPTGTKYYYRYQVEMDFVIVNVYKSNHAAKIRVFREYVKLRDNGKKEKQNS
jgi:hypothetical protein